MAWMIMPVNDAGQSTRHGTNHATVYMTEDVERIFSLLPAYIADNHDKIVLCGTTCTSMCKNLQSIPAQLFTPLNNNTYNVYDFESKTVRYNLDTSEPATPFFGMVFFRCCDTYYTVIALSRKAEDCPMAFNWQDGFELMKVENVVSPPHNSARHQRLSR